jgi:DNA-binding NarL/FixJ family response regulator
MRTSHKIFFYVMIIVKWKIHYIFYERIFYNNKMFESLSGFGEDMEEHFDNDFYLNEKHGKQLTQREYEVLKLITMGESNTEIAKELNISVHTAKAHVCSILQKMGVNDRVQAAVKAVRQDII